MEIDFKMKELFLWIVFGVFPIINMDSFHHSVSADKGWLVFIHQRPSSHSQQVTLWLCLSPAFTLSLSPLPFLSYSIDWQMQMRGTAQQNINVDFTEGEVDLVSQPRV